MTELNATAASLLGFLAGGEARSGWELAQVAQVAIGSFWNLTRSQVYRELRDLAARGLVEPGEPGPRDRVPYRITDGGRREFDAWIASAPGPDLIRHRLLLTVLFSEHLPAGRLAEILADQRAAHVDQLEGYRRLRAPGPGGSVAATLAFGIAYEEMVLVWLDEVAAPLARRTR